MNKILSVNFTIPGDESFIPFNSNSLLSDADIVLFDPYSSSSYEEKNEYWHHELSHILELGKTVFVFLNGAISYANAFLPNMSIEFVRAQGINVFPKEKLFEPIYNTFKEYWKVECYMNIHEEAIEIFGSKSNDRILGALFQVKNGYLIFLPDLDFPFNELTNGEEWNQLGIEIGKSFKQQLSHIHNELNSIEETTIIPDWVDQSEFELIAVKELITQVDENINKINAIQIENDNLLSQIKHKQVLKNLLFETGKALEHGVIQALQILGYLAENYDDGILELDQVIISPEGERFIGECEGKDNKAIDIGKFRQLQDNLNEDFHREEVNEKAFGLLFGNPQRLINPAERNFDFTDKCKKGAEREKIGLINTVDLYRVAKYLSEYKNESFKLECRSFIKNQLGSIITFPQIPK